MSELRRMRSIGRTLKPSTLLLSAGIAGLLATAGAGTLYTRKVIESLEQNGPIEVSAAPFTRLGQLTWNISAASSTQRRVAERSIEEKIARAQNESLPEPRLVKAELRRKPSERVRVLTKIQTIDASEFPAPAEVLQVSRTASSEQAPVLIASGSDEIRLSAAAAVRSINLDGPPEVSSPVKAEDGLASETELLTIQRMHSRVYRQFLVATQDLEKYVRKNELLAKVSAGRISAVTQYSDADYSTLRDQYLATVDQSRAVVIHDEIDTSMAAATVRRRMPVRSQKELEKIAKLRAHADEQKASAVAFMAPDLADVAAPSESEKAELKIKIAVKEAPAASQGLTTQTTLAPAPKPVTMPLIAGTLKVAAKPVQEAQAHRTEKVDPSSKVAAANPLYEEAPQQLHVAARVVDPNEPAPRMTTQRPRDYSNDDPTGDENDYSFLDTQDGANADHMNNEASNITVDRKTNAVTIVPNQMGSSASVKARTASPPQAKQKRTPGAVIVESAPARPKTYASQTEAVSSNPGVVKDANGVTIAWASSKTRELRSSLVDELSAKASAPVKLPDPKRYCDSALIGVAAFSASPTAETISVCRRPLSHEGSAAGSQAKWWEVRESVEHWPTLIYQKEKEAFGIANRIPMLSTHSAKGLALLSKTKINQNAGIILGEIPTGAELELSTRAEGALYFDAQFQQLDKREGAKYFAYLNVAPGNPLLFVRLKNATRGGSIPLVVRPSFVTYVRVPAPLEKNLSVRILDSTSYQKPKPMKGLSVRVIGQDGKSAVTNSGGEITLNGVLTFGDYPIYLDVAPGDKIYRHRYRITSDKMKGRDLFYFNESTVQGWVSQLDGGISPLSGIVVGAFSGVPAQQKEAYVRFQNLERRSHLNPEVYILGSEDNLITLPKVTQDYTRFIGVQVPEGVQIPSALKQDGTILFSEIVIAQPGVINVLSP